MVMEWLKIVGVVSGLVGLLYGVHRVGRRYQWHPEWQRKTLHVGLGLTALSFPWLFDATWQVAAVSLLGTAVMMTVRLVPGLRQSVGCTLHRVGRSSLGELLFALAIVLLFALAQGSPIRYLLPLAILTLADTAAALVGTHWGRRRFQVLDGEKSWEGVGAFALVTCVLATLFLALLTSLSWPMVLLLSVFVTLIGTCTEAIAWRGLDNLLVPLAGFLTLATTLDGGVIVLLYQLAGMTLISVAVQMSPLSRMPHSALTAVLVSTCLWIGGPLLWLPVLLALLLAHAVAAKRLNRQILAPFDALPMHYWLALGQ